MSNAEYLKQTLEKLQEIERTLSPEEKEAYFQIFLAELNENPETLAILREFGSNPDNLNDQRAIVLLQARLIIAGRKSADKIQ